MSDNDDGVTVVLRSKIKPETWDEYVPFIHEMLKVTATKPGFRSLRAVSNKDNPYELLFIEEWDSEEDYQAYLKFRIDNGDMETFKRDYLDGEHTVEIWPKTVASI